MELVADDNCKSSFAKNPLTFLHDWLAVRRKGQEFLHTPMGYVCQSRSLTQNHPFFRKRDGDNTATLNAGSRALDEWNPDEYAVEQEDDEVFEEFYDAHEDFDSSGDFAGLGSVTTD